MWFTSHPTSLSDRVNYRRVRLTWSVYSLLSLFLRGAIVPCQLWVALAEVAISNSVSIRWLRWVWTTR